MKRREFITRTTQTGFALSTLGAMAFKKPQKLKRLPKGSFGATSLFFKISLAEWSLHRALFSKKLKPLDFASEARKAGCEGVEYVNVFFKDKAQNKSYLKEMNVRSDSEGVKNVLIMIDGEGALAGAITDKRLKAVENHYKWVDAAHFLGCHAIRVNLAGGIDKKEAAKASVDSLTRLSDFAKKSNVNILVENHGGFSSDGLWLSDVMSQVENKNCGTLPDFGNFCIERKKKQCVNKYDKYKGIAELMPYAKAVSAKSYEFNSEGEETTIDYFRMMKIVKDAGYTGFVGIEYEGDGLSETDGIKRTRELLIRVGKKLM